MVDCVLPYHAESETRLDCGSIICGCRDSCLHLVAGIHNQDQTAGVASLLRHNERGTFGGYSALVLMFYVLWYFVLQLLLAVHVGYRGIT